MGSLEVTSKLDRFHVTLFEFDTQSVGDAVHECIVGDDRAGIVDRLIIQPGRTKRLHVVAADSAGCECKLFGIRHQRSLCLVEARHTKGTRGQRGEDRLLAVRIHSIRTQYPTETRSVMVNSIAAFVQNRHADGEHFPLAWRERPGTVHQLQVDLVMLAHHSRMHRMDLDDVVPIRNALGGRELRITEISNECHESDLRKEWAISGC